MQGWVKLQREMLNDTTIMKDAEHIAVWVWLLANACYTECESVFNGKQITLHSGQLITSTQKIADALNIERTKVHRILNEFENSIQSAHNLQHKIVQEMGAKMRLITITFDDDVECEDEQKCTQNATQTQEKSKQKRNYKRKYEEIKTHMRTRVCDFEERTYTEEELMMNITRIEDLDDIEL